MVKKSERHTQGKRKPKTGAANRGFKKGQGALKAGTALKHSNASAKPGRTAPNGETRVRKDGSHFRSEGTIKRLQMYTSKPNMDRMKKQPTKPVRIQPDRRWFGNTRVIAQDKMQAFRQTIAKGVEDPFSVVLRSSKLPMSLLRDTDGKATRMDLLSISPYSEVFSKKRQQKRVKLGSYELEGLLESADKKAESYDSKKDLRSQVDAAGLERETDNSVAKSHVLEEIFAKGTSRRIWGELYKVIDASDVIIFVLDARDPMGTRCEQLERELRKTRAHKHIVLLLNKVDLVPTWVSRRWVHTLMKDFPTLAFHASITNPFGKSALLNLLRQFSTLLKEKKHVTVGMIGYPNVGKSAVINTLKRKKVCKTAPVPGETRVWQYIALTQRLYLLDCPGIVPPTANDFEQDCAKVLKGAIRAERMENPSMYIDEVLSRVKKQYLIQKYKLPTETTWEDGEEFLSIIGQKMGKLLRGGEPDLETSARIVLYDWQRGRIPYFVAPPEEEGESEKPKAAETNESSVEAGKALADGAADAGEDSAAAEGAAAEEEGKPRVEVQPQSFDELVCALPFDEEDQRRGADAAGGPEAAGQGRAPKRKRGGAEAGDDAGDDAGRGAATRKKRRRGRGASGASGLLPTARRGMQVKQGSVDWNAVVAEFGM